MRTNDKAIKRQDVHELVKKAWDAGKIQLNTKHARDERGPERDIDIQDVRDVILYGVREESEDRDRGYSLDVCNSLR